MFVNVCLIKKIFLSQGAIFHKDDEDLKATFERAIRETRNEHLAPAFKLIPIIMDVDVDTDSFNTAAASKCTNMKFKNMS